MREGLKTDRFDWVVAPLADHPSFIQKSMFGCLSYYLFGKLVLVTSHDREPWKGLLIPTERQHHESLLREFPQLTKHPVLGKWLYLSEATEEFEEISQKIIACLQTADPRFGVVTFPKKRARKKKTHPSGR